MTRWRKYEIAAGPDGALNWSENPVALVAHVEEGGPEALEAEIGRILAAVASAPSTLAVARPTSGPSETPREPSEAIVSVRCIID